MRGTPRREDGRRDGSNWRILLQSQRAEFNGGVEISMRERILLVGDRDGRQRKLVLDHFPFTVGRRTDCDLAIAYPQVSRQHAHFSLEGDDVYIVDDTSWLGTLVNGDWVKRCKLKPGDKVEFGGQGVVWVLFDPAEGDALESIRLR
jgi:pSer/pThr/pTyr-binding forkhead associated (FHA) protein